MATYSREKRCWNPTFQAQLSRVRERTRNTSDATTADSYPMPACFMETAMQCEKHAPVSAKRPFPPREWQAATSSLGPYRRVQHKCERSQPAQDMALARACLSQLKKVKCSLGGSCHILHYMTICGNIIDVNNASSHIFLYLLISSHQRANPRTQSSWASQLQLGASTGLMQHWQGKMESFLDRPHFWTTSWQIDEERPDKFLP